MNEGIEIIQSAMTVGELIELLQRYPENMPVLMPKAGADYWGRVALTSPSAYRIEDLQVHYSDYHSAMLVTPDLDEASEEQELAPDERLEALVLG